MSQKNKTQLKATNNANFPNNNSAFITPEKLRDFNTDILFVKSFLKWINSF